MNSYLSKECHSLRQDWEAGKKGSYFSDRLSVAAGLIRDTVQINVHGRLLGSKNKSPARHRTRSE